MAIFQFMVKLGGVFRVGLEGLFGKSSLFPQDGKILDRQIDAGHGGRYRVDAAR